MSRNKVAERGVEVNSLSSPHRAVRRQTIYLVDADQPVRKSLQSLLSLFGYAVETFGTASDLLAIPELSDVACVIMVNLPDAVGPETQSALRDRGITAPIYILSGNGSETVRQASQHLKAAGFFERPVQMQTLLDTTKSAIRSASL